MQKNLRQTSTEQFHRNTFITTASSSLGVIASVILDALVMALFGLSSVTDAYFVASTIPMVATTVMTLQASKVVQPMFISAREQLGEAKGWQFLNLFMTIGTWVAIVLAGICALLSPLIVRIQAPGFDHEALAMGSTLSYFFFLVLPLTWPTVIMRVALNSVGEFWIAGTGKFVESSLKIIFVLALSETVGVLSLVFGMLVGSFCQLLLSYFSLKQRGYRFSYIFNIHHPELRRAFVLMLYPLGGQASGMLVDIISNNLSSLLGPGKVTALRFATRIIDVLAGVLANSIVTVAMPVVASAVTRKEDGRAMECLRQSIYLLLFVTIPVSIWLAMANRQLIAMVYQRMNFTASDVDLVSGILVLLIPYIFLSRLLGLAELPFFAGGEARTPMLAGIARAGTCILLMYILFNALGLFTFPIARSISYCVGPVYLLLIISARWGGVNWKSLVEPTARIMLASTVMAVCLFAGHIVVADMPGGGGLISGLKVVIPSVLGGFVMIFVLALLKVVSLRRAEGFPFIKLSLCVI